MLTNWHFDIFRSRHWEHLYNLWYQGWTIQAPKEWAFILIILTFIPLWLTGWAALSLIAWDKLLIKLTAYPIKWLKNLFYKPVKVITTPKTTQPIKKKRSYKEIRPRSIRTPIDDRVEDALPRPTPLSNQINKISQAPKKPIISTPAPISTPQPSEPKNFEHSLFQFDDGESDDFDFNFDAFDTPAQPPKHQPAPKEENKIPQHDKEKNKNNRDNKKDFTKPNKDSNRPQTGNKNENQAISQRNGTIMDTLKQKGYEIITGATLANNLIDFIGVSEKQICVCLLDKEPGDWLADEERFNDEEPLWFSESSHRISPVRKIALSCHALEDKLKEADLNFTIIPYVIIQLGNIINAEDMFEIWEGMKINVTRVDRGTPKEIKLFAKTLEEAENHIDKDKFEKVKKLIRNIK